MKTLVKLHCLLMAKESLNDHSTKIQFMIGDTECLINSQDPCQSSDIVSATCPPELNQTLSQIRSGAAIIINGMMDQKSIAVNQISVLH